MSNTFDSVWEKRYRENPSYRGWYPWTAVVSFVFNRAPRDRPRGEVRILEVGCGTANNLWFAAREGFQVAGVDISETAIEFARERFAREGLAGDLCIGNFVALPFSDAAFDLAFERAALSFTTREGAQACVAELHRVLKPGGFFQCGVYSDRDSSCYRTPDADGAVRDIKKGTIVGGSQTCFYSEADLRRLLADGWDIVSMKHVEESELIGPEPVLHCEWLAVARRVERKTQ